MEKLMRYIWRRYGDTYVETKEIHMAKLWRYTQSRHDDTQVETVMIP
jgi:hypothetical protein